MLVFQRQIGHTAAGQVGSAAAGVGVLKVQEWQLKQLCSDPVASGVAFTPVQ